MKCKVCNSSTELWTTVDSNKSCNNATLILGQVPIHYYKCTSCGFLQTIQYDDWTPEDYLEFIYNDEYGLSDPEYDGTRAKRDAHWLDHYLKHDVNISILDYGSGLGHLEKSMREKGYQAITSYDPFSKYGIGKDFPGRFDLVTSFEVFEHTIEPHKIAVECINWLVPGGKILISTLVNNDQPKDCWYLSPRNGHIAMHSYQSLDRLFEKYGMRVKHLSPSTHEVIFN
jgi:2-polyprenyl-6-hydroxyphenyl methylase/3-demethylubiquinone-9 3-methyltransferase